MSTENHMLYISKQDLAYFFTVGLKLKFTNVYAVWLEIAGGLRMVMVYNWERIGRNLFDYTCYYKPNMKVRLR